MSTQPSTLSHVLCSFAFAGWPLWFKSLISLLPRLDYDKKVVRICHRFWSTGRNRHVMLQPELSSAPRRLCRPNFRTLWPWYLCDSHFADKTSEMAHARQLLYQDSVCPVDPRRLFLVFLSFHPLESFKTLDKMEREDEFLQFTPNSLFWDFHWARRTQQQNEPVTGGLNGLASESWQSV